MRVRMNNVIFLVMRVESLDDKIILYTFPDGKSLTLYVSNEEERDSILQGLYLEGFLDIKSEWLQEGEEYEKGLLLQDLL